MNGWIDFEHGHFTGGRPRAFKDARPDNEIELWRQLDAQAVPGTSHEVKFDDRKKPMIVHHIDDKIDLIVNPVKK